MKNAKWIEVNSENGIDEITISAGYDIIFIGDDYCDRLIIENKTLEKIYLLTQKNGVSLGIKTPVISESIISRFCLMIDYIIERKMNVFITVNDWGLLSYILSKSYDGIEIITGRFLVRQKTDRFTISLRNAIPENVYQHFCTPTLLNQAFFKFAKEHGLKIFEIENVPNEILLPEINDSYLIMLTYPYVCTALTRYCPYYEYKNNCLKISDCNFECRNNKIRLSANVHGDYEYISNALVYENRELQLKTDIYILLDEAERGQYVENSCAN
jgi:hypothetical protein